MKLILSLLLASVVSAFGQTESNSCDSSIPLAMIALRSVPHGTYVMVAELNAKTETRYKAFNSGSLTVGNTYYFYGIKQGKTVFNTTPGVNQYGVKVDRQPLILPNIYKCRDFTPKTPFVFGAKNNSILES